VTLREIIEKEICERGAIPFSRYMELCLYHPGLGYYSRNAEQFGKAGDFYTSSDVHAVFGRLLARQFEEMWRSLGSPERIQILELGPGRGLFAQDVLDWSEKKFPEFFRGLHFSLMERSPALRVKIGETLSKFLESGRATLISGGESELEEIDFNSDVPVVIFANEFFDALPVEILSPDGVLRVSINGGRFIETWVAPSAEEMEFLDRNGVQPLPGERIEVPLIASRYMTRLAASVGTGFVIAIDYGYTRQEQLAGRHRGTLMTYRRHSATPNPYEAPGEQDITTHANFTSLMAAAENTGMQVQPLVTQSQFLMGIGEDNQFADVFEDCRLPQERAKVALQLKHLVTPDGMGESFRVLLASKSIDPELVAGLSGLSFASSRL
jgi:SAM-dependent MidA family methyltransferase